MVDFKDLFGENGINIGPVSVSAMGFQYTTTETSVEREGYSGKIEAFRYNTNCG